MKYNKALADYVDKKFSIRDLYAEYMNRSAGEGKCFCPFHHNVNTPAAKIYGNSLKCFGVCNRMFSVFDFLNRFYPERLEDILKSQVLPQTNKTCKKFTYLRRDELDLSKPLEEIYDKILKYEES